MCPQHVTVQGWKNVSSVRGAPGSKKSSELPAERLCKRVVPLPWSPLSPGEVAVCLLGLQLPLCTTCHHRRCWGPSDLHLPAACPRGGCPGGVSPGLSFPFSALAAADSAPALVPLSRWRFWGLGGRASLAEGAAVPCAREGVGKQLLTLKPPPALEAGLLSSSLSA